MITLFLPAESFQDLDVIVQGLQTVIMQSGRYVIRIIDAVYGVFVELFVTVLPQASDARNNSTGLLYLFDNDNILHSPTPHF